MFFELSKPHFLSDSKSEWQLMKLAKLVDWLQDVDGQKRVCESDTEMCTQ